MEDSELITRLLDINQPMSNNPKRFSTIILSLRGARKLFGCDLVTGEYLALEMNDENWADGTYRSFQLTGITSYLILLEQVGSILKPKTATKLVRSNGIFCALKHFSSIDDIAINAIVSLRNSLTHRYGLATEKKPKTQPPRKFTLSTDRNKLVVQLPKTDWDGTFLDKSAKTYTTIFVIDLVVLVENVFKRIKVEHEEGTLKLALRDGAAELKARYTIIDEITD